MKYYSLPSIQWVAWLVGLALLTACAGLPQPPVAVADTAAPLAETAPETPTPDPLANCPVPGNDTGLYVSRANGYCLLYPAGAEIQVDPQMPEGTIRIAGTGLEPPEKSLDTVVVIVMISRNGPADGLDSQSYAAEWQKRFAPDSPLQQASIAGQPAPIISNYQPGMFNQRSAFIVANGYKYQITITPQPEDFFDLKESAERLWQIVTSSIVFFPPEYTPPTVRAQDVCPQETPETRLYLHEVDGYCFLYPADFEPAPDFPGQVIGGPVLGQVEDFGDVRTSLTLGTYGRYPGQTPRQVLAPRLEFVDAASLQDRTIGGYPAVVFRDLNGAWVSRQALIIVQGNAYTIVAQPWEPERFSAGMPYLEKVWRTVTDSLAFFTPWR